MSILQLFISTFFEVIVLATTGHLREIQKDFVLNTKRFCPEAKAL
jgi:hypothetical protein